MKPITGKIAFIAVCVLSALLINSIIDFAFGAYHNNLDIHRPTFILIMIFLILASAVKQVLNRVMVYFWYFFYLAGLLFVNNAAVSDPKFGHLTNLGADNFFFLNLIALTCGFLVSERVWRKRNKTISIEKQARLSYPIFFLLLLYPFVFFVIIYTTLGFIPILSGESIVDDMYNLNYGGIYGFKFYVIISILVAIFYSFKGKRLLYILLAVVFALISLLDGKRAVLLVAVVAGLVLYYLHSVKFSRVRTGLIVLALTGAVVAYAGLAILRTGRDNELNSMTSVINKFPVGVEYADYVYSFEKFTPGSIQGYDFLKSSFGSFMNSAVLTFMGLDKEEMVASGSAYSWMREYNSDLGIRTGIVCELYFDYGYFTLLIVFLLAFWCDYINRMIFATKDLMSFLLLLSVYGFHVLLIVGQATVYFGSLTLIVYLYFANKLFAYLSPRRYKKKAIASNPQ